MAGANGEQRPPRRGRGRGAARLPQARIVRAAGRTRREVAGILRRAPQRQGLDLPRQGPAPVHRGTQLTTQPRASQTSRVPGVFAVVLLCLSVLCAWAAISLSFGARLHPLRVSVDALLVPAPANLGYAAFLLILATGVHNRKRVAYWMLVAYFVIQLAADVFLLVSRDNRGEEAHR